MDNVTCDENEIAKLIPRMPLTENPSIGNHSLETIQNFSADGRLQGFNFSISELCNILKEERTERRLVSGGAELVLIVVYSALITAGLAANVAVCYVVARRSQMYTPRNLYIVNLTISDMSLCLVCMPFTLVQLLTRRWALGAALCKLVPVLQGTNIMVSTGTIAVIALDRYFAIVRRSPTEGGASAGKSNKRPKRIVISIAAVWAISVTAAMPLLFTQHVEVFDGFHPELIYEACIPSWPNDFQPEFVYETCIEKWPNNQLKLAYTVATLIIMYVIPIGVVAAVHARIASFLRVHATALAGGSTAGRASRELIRNRRITTLLTGVSVLFAVSWLPHYVLSVLVDADPGLMSTQQLYVMTAVCHAIAMSSAISNPIVYGWLNTNIRREFLTLLPPTIVACCCRRRNKNLQGHDDNGAGRSGMEGCGLSVGVGFLGDTSNIFDEKSTFRAAQGGTNGGHLSPARGGATTSTTVLLLPPPRGIATTPTSSNHLQVSQL